MMQRCLLIDDEGDTWPIVDSEFRRRFASHMPAEQFRDYAVVNLGFVSWEDGEGWTHIRLRKGKVSSVALTALLFRLADRRLDRTALSVLDAGWEHQIFGDAKSLFARIEQLSTEIFDEDTHRFLSEPVPFDDLKSTDPQVVLYRHWKARRFESPNMADLCSDLFAGRFTIARVLPSLDMRIEHLGCGYRIYNNNYVDKACGTRLQDEPDTVYGRWVARIHKDVHLTGSPLLEDVDALIGASRSVRRRVRYRRIVLPFSNSAGEAFLVTASTNSTVDLRQRIA